MGALINLEQRQDVQEKVNYLRDHGCDVLCGGQFEKLDVIGADSQHGAFIHPRCCIVQSLLNLQQYMKSRLLVQSPR